MGNPFVLSVPQSRNNLIKVNDLLIVSHGGVGLDLNIDLDYHDLAA